MVSKEVKLFIGGRDRFFSLQEEDDGRICLACVDTGMDIEFYFYITLEDFKFIWTEMLKFGNEARDRQEQEKQNK